MECLAPAAFSRLSFKSSCSIQVMQDATGIPSWELTYQLPKWYFWVDDFPFPKVGYVSFLEGMHLSQNLSLISPRSSLLQIAVTIISHPLRPHQVPTALRSWANTKGCEGMTGNDMKTYVHCGPRLLDLCSHEVWISLVEAIFLLAFRCNLETCGWHGISWLTWLSSLHEAQLELGLSWRPIDHKSMPCKMIPVTVERPAWMNWNQNNRSEVKTKL